MKFPEGWKLVPVEPTVEMRRAGTAANDGIVSDIYRAMLAAAPQPPSAFPFPVSYDTASDTLTINGKRYAAGLFDERGLLAPAGTVVRIEDGPGDVVTLTTIYPPSAQADERDCPQCRGHDGVLSSSPAQADAVEALRELVEALDGANISSWQSTAAWQTQLDRARAVLAAQGGNDE